MKRRGYAARIVRFRRKARQRTQVATNEDALLAVLRWWAMVANDPHVIQGQRGPTRLRILTAIRDLAMQAGRIELDESMRELADAAGVSCATVCRYQAELEPWVSVVASNGQYGVRTRWRLRTDLCVKNDADAAESLLHTASGQRKEVAAPTNGQWNAWAGGWALYGILDAEEGQTSAEIADRIGKHAGSVRRNLVRLSRIGLAQRDKRGRWTAIAGTHEQNCETER